MAGVKSLEQQGSKGSPGLLLIAYAPDQGAGFCLVDDTLYAVAMNADGTLDMEPDYVEPPGMNWVQVCDLGPEHLEELRPIINALGGDFETVISNLDI